MSPVRDPSADDPLEIVGVVLDRPIDDDGLGRMARTFIEEYTLMGWPPKRILGVFQNPFYAGAHDAYEALGETQVRALIEEVALPEEAGDDG
jgi:hypothetical protein